MDPLKLDSIDKHEFTMDDMASLDKAMDEAGLEEMSLDQVEQKIAGMKGGDFSQNKPAEVPAPEEKKEETPAPAAPPEEKKEVQEPETPQAPATPAPAPDPDEEVIEAPKGMNKSQASNWKRLSDRAETKTKLAKELAAKLAAQEAAVKELQSKVGKPDENLLKELTELREHRRAFDIQNDPEFVNKYDVPVQNLSTEIFEILKAHQVTPEILELIKTSGSLTTKSMKWWQENYITPLENSDSPLDNDHAFALKRSLEKIRELNYERTKEVSSASKNQSEWSKKREEAAKTANESFENTVFSVVNETRSKVPWANLREIPSNASNEERAAIEKSNEFYKSVVEPVFRSAMYSTDPKTRAQHAMEAVLARRLIMDMDDLIAERDSLKEQIATLRNTGKTNVNKVPNAPKTPVSKPEDSLAGNIEDALEKQMQAFGI